MQEKPVTVIDSYALATQVERMIAFAIDFIIALVLVSFPHRYGWPLGLQYAGGIVSFLYLFFKDSLPFLHYRSIGKRILGLSVVNRNKLHVGVIAAVKRNIIFIPNFLLILNYEHFHYIVLWLNGAAFLMEIYLMYLSSDNQRLGDTFADTVVIEN